MEEVVMRNTNAGIMVADCTCGDGIATLGWDFGKAARGDIVNKLKTTHVDILELGILEKTADSKKRKEPDTFKFSDIEDAHKKINPHPCCSYALSVMDIHKFPVDCFINQKDSFINYIFISVRKKELEQGLQYCADVKRRGYRVVVFPDCVDFYTDSEFMEFMGKVSQLSPYAVFITNEFGTMRVRGLSHDWHLADEILQEQIALGYCANYHDVPELKAFLKILANTKNDRKVILGTSACGMGNRTGGLHTETVLDELNRFQQNMHYQIYPIFELYDKYLKIADPAAEKKKKLLCMAAKKHKVNPGYAVYLGLEKNIAVYHVDQILKRIPCGQRMNFNKSDACFYQKQYYNDYWKKRLCVIIFTADREKAIQYWLKIQSREFERLGITLVIYDSSRNDKTKEVVQRYIEKGIHVLHYERYEQSYNGMSIDEKVISAYRKYSEKYEYIWGFRDGLILNLPLFLDDLDELLRNGPDLIVVNDYSRDYLALGQRYYKDCQSLFADQCIQMTVLGGTVIRGSVIRNIICEEPLDAEKNMGMWQPIAFFDYFARHGVISCSFVGSMFLPNPKVPESSFWTRNMLWQWGERWYRMIMGLPHIYDPYKKEVLKVEMSDFHPFSMLFLFKARENGGLTICKLRKYKKYIPYVCDTPMWKFYMVALVPRWLACLLQKKEMHGWKQLLMNLYFSVREFLIQKNEKPDKKDEKQDAENT